MADDEKKSKIVSDEGWKEEARKEKEKLKGKTTPESKSSAAAGESAAGEESFGGGLPPAAPQTPRRANLQTHERHSFEDICLAKHAHTYLGRGAYRTLARL